MRFLCCDLGGTNTDWGVYDATQEDFVFRRTCETDRFEDFYEMLDEVLVEYRGRFDQIEDRIVNATFGIAGPTDHKIVRPTNLPGWEVNVSTINGILGEFGHDEYSSVINDFEALGYGVLYYLENGFSGAEYDTIYGKFRARKPRPGERMVDRSLICGPGTGLGISCVVEGLMKDGFPFIVSSEGGHCTMAIETREQFRLLGGEIGTFSGMRSYETFLSHVGLRNIYNIIRRQDYNAEPAWQIGSKEIIGLAATGKDQAATDAIDLFCQILANFCGNAALHFNCDKSIFLWGGVLKDMPVELLSARFKAHYPDRCKLNDRVGRVPVVLLRDKNLPLLGCVLRSRYEVDHVKPT